MQCFFALGVIILSLSCQYRYDGSWCRQLVVGRCKTGPEQVRLSVTPGGLHVSPQALYCLLELWERPALVASGYAVVLYYRLLLDCPVGWERCRRGCRAVVATFIVSHAWQPPLMSQPLTVCTATVHGCFYGCSRVLPATSVVALGSVPWHDYAACSHSSSCVKARDTCRYCRPCVAYIARDTDRRVVGEFRGVPLGGPCQQGLPCLPKGYYTSQVPSSCCELDVHHQASAGSSPKPQHRFGIRHFVLHSRVVPVDTSAYGKAWHTVKTAV